MFSRKAWDRQYREIRKKAVSEALVSELVKKAIDKHGPEICGLKERHGQKMTISLALDGHITVDQKSAILWYNTQDGSTHIARIGL